MLSMPIPACAILLAAMVLPGAGIASEGSEPTESLLERPEPFGAALRLRLGEDFRVLRLGIQAGSADADVQDPRVPANVDRYVFEDGAFGAPEPVQAGRSRRKLEARLFRFAEVDLAVLPRLLADATRRAETPDARASQVTIERSEGYGEYESWGRPVIRVVVEGPRGGAVVEYRLTGKHFRTIRW
jgi:hypothetical protein